MQQNAVKIRTEGQTAVEAWMPRQHWLEGSISFTGLSVFYSKNSVNGGPELATLSLRSVRFRYISNLLENASKT